MANTRQLHVLGATGKTRMEQYEGRDHLVVPVIALMEGVIHAINAETPEFVPLDALTAAPHTWNGRPIMLGHPVHNGQQVSANDRRVLETQSFGQIFNARVDGKKLHCEAWIDPEKAEKIGAGDLVRRMRLGEMTEVSVGAFVSTDATPGQHNGKTYKAIWRGINPDHLAFLPTGRGACSVEMGCGSVRTAESHPVLHVLADFQAEGYLPRLRAADASGWTASGEEEAELIRYRTLRVLLDQVGTTYEAASKLVTALIVGERVTDQMADEAAETARERAQLDSIFSLCLSMSSTLATIMNETSRASSPQGAEPSPARYMAADRAALQTLSESYLALSAACGNSQEMAEFSATEADQQSAKGDRVMKPLIKTLTECACSGFTAADVTMLESASEERLQAWVTLTETRKADAAALKAAQEQAAATAAEVVTLKAAAAQKPELTEEQFMAAAPASIKTLIETKKAEDAARHVALVTTLKTAQAEYTEAELDALPLAQLERLSRVAKVAEPAVDFRGRALPRVAEETNAKQYAPVDAYAADLKALQATQR